MTNEHAAAMPILRYGGFWIRAVAMLIDGFILGIALGLLGAVTGLDFFADDPDQISWLAVAVQLAVDWLYEAGLTASPLGGTLGKRAVGLRVVTEQGERISFARSTGRCFAKIVSGLLLLIGFLMAAFTERKRGLHDMIAGTVVVKTD
ncbi:MAG: RDD family protein [Reyranellales bacterium]